MKLFHEAARRIPAYKDFLEKHKVKPERIKTKADFAHVPTTDKPSYISQYSLEELSWNGTLSSAKYISTSSGSTGTPFFWPRGHNQDVAVALMFQKIYETIFDSKNGSTLFIDSFALGTWIAGLEFYNATKWTAEQGSPIVIATPGIDKFEAVNEIQKLAPAFRQIILGGYPPFIKDIIEFGKSNGIVWEHYDLRLFLGGEAISEAWRDRILKTIGKENQIKRTVNIYGMAESGVVGHETPTSILFQRILRDLENNKQGLPDYNEVKGVYQYYPIIRYLEAGKDKSLTLTTEAGLPLIRYDTGDHGGVLDFSTVMEKIGDKLVVAAKESSVDLSSWRLPFTYLYGRRDLSVSLYALQIYVENIKSTLENFKNSSKLSGLFIMSVDHTPTLDQQFNIVVELSEGIKASDDLRKEITVQVVNELQKLNTEYAKLYASMGERATPKIRLVKFGEINTRPGRKHKWVKRS